MLDTDIVWKIFFRWRGQSVSFSHAAQFKSKVQFVRTDRQLFIVKQWERLLHRTPALTTGMKHFVSCLNVAPSSTDVFLQSLLCVLRPGTFIQVPSSAKSLFRSWLQNLHASIDHCFPRSDLSIGNVSCCQLLSAVLWLSPARGYRVASGKGKIQVFVHKRGFDGQILFFCFFLFFLFFSVFFVFFCFFCFFLFFFVFFCFFCFFLFFFVFFCFFILKP